MVPVALAQSFRIDCRLEYFAACQPLIALPFQSIARRTMNRIVRPVISRCTPRTAPAPRIFLGHHTNKPRTFAQQVLRNHYTRSMSTTAPIAAAKIEELQKYTACDVSDALLKLKVPGAGFVADLNLYSPLQLSLPAATNDQAPVTVCPVSTVLFTPKDESSPEADRPAANVPKDAHWVDLAVPGTFAVLKQPLGQTNAVCGGIMALRMKVLGVKGIIVAGRVRDLVELRSTELPVRINCFEFMVLVADIYFFRFGHAALPPLDREAVQYLGQLRCPLKSTAWP